MKNDANEELSRLTSLLLDGEISDSDHIRLSNLLSESAHNRKAYLEYIRIESLLHWESENAEATAMPPITLHQPLYRFPFWLGSAAAVFLAMFVIWWTQLPVQEVDSLASTQPFLPSSKDAETTSVVLNNDAKAHQLDSSSLHKINLMPYGVLGREEKAKRAIEIALGTNDSSPEGITEYFGSVKRWSRLHSMLAPAENGILPASGSSMIGFDKMSVSVESQTAEVEETVQVLDIREVIKDSSSDHAKVYAAVKFNQSYGLSQEGAEFGITLQAFKKEENLSPQELVRSDQTLSSDRDPSTWNELSSELVIPKDAQFVVVSLTARKSGPDSVLANSSSYYADDLQLFLAIDDQLTLGPI